LGLLRFLFIIFIGVIILRAYNVLAAWFKQGYARKGSQKSSSGPSRGRMTIDVDPRNPQKNKPKVGEYVDFEDIKD
jgi:hypothetical protein